MKIIDSQGRVFGRMHLLDLLVWILLASALPLLYFGYQTLRGSAELKLLCVEPAMAEAGPDARVMLTGSGFDRDTTVLVGEYALVPRFLNEAQIDFALPVEINPGYASISIRNGRGRMIYKNTPLKVLWRPELHQVGLRVTPQGTGALIVQGKYLEMGCDIRLGNLAPLYKTYTDSQHVTSYYRIQSLQKGSYSVSLHNPQSDLSLLVPDAIRIDQPLMPAVPLEVYCVVRASDPNQIEQLRTGWIYQDSFDRVSAEILEVLTSRALPIVSLHEDASEAVHLVFARMRLMGQIEIVPGGPPYYNLEAEHIVIGNRIFLPQQGKPLELIVLSRPILVEPVGGSDEP